MRKIEFIILSVALSMSTIAWAVELPAVWVTCKIDTDCTEVSSICGESQAVHHRYKEQALAKICAVEDCKAPGCDHSGRQAWAAKCIQDKCVPDFDAKMPEQNMRFELKDLHMECPKDNPNCGLASTPNGQTH